MIYGAIGINFKSRLVINHQTIDSWQYKKKILDSKMIPMMDEMRSRGNWVFQQDGGKCHTYVDSTAWFSSKCKYLKVLS